MNVKKNRKIWGPCHLRFKKYHPQKGGGEGDINFSIKIHTPDEGGNSRMT